MSTAKFTVSAGSPLGAGLSKKVPFPCPLCGKRNADYRLSPGGNNIACWSCAAAGLDGGDYLRALAVEVGANGGGALLEDPARYLAHLAAGPPTRRGRREEPPSRAAVAGWQSRLRSDRPAMRYLREERGLTGATISRHRLGYDGEAITMPVLRRRRAVNLRRRFLAPDAKPKMRGLAGHRARLYPFAPPDDAWLLCEGEFDAVVARQHGLPAVTSTAGTHWASAWDGYLPGRRVAVVYDAGAGSLRAAAQRAAKLREAGAEDAWAVALGSAGLHDGEDLTDWFVHHNKTAADLKALIRHEREAPR